MQIESKKYVRHILVIIAFDSYPPNNRQLLYHILHEDIVGKVSQICIAKKIYVSHGVQICETTWIYLREVLVLHVASNGGCQMEIYFGGGAKHHLVGAKKQKFCSDSSKTLCHNFTKNEKTTHTRPRNTCQRCRCWLNAGQ